jgi:hypothetical protein
LFKKYDRTEGSPKITAAATAAAAMTSFMSIRRRISASVRAPRSRSGKIASKSAIAPVAAAGIQIGTRYAHQTAQATAATTAPRSAQRPIVSA